LSHQPPRTVALVCHPSTPTTVVHVIDVGVTSLPDGSVRLRYFLDGEIERIVLPPRGAAQRAERLWQHTCFEAFLARSDARAYCELNFSPSGEWAAYGFSAYRDGMSLLSLDHGPEIAVSTSDDRLALEATVGPDIMLALPGTASLHLALSAVIEEERGRLSYWALAHPAERPDFHHPGGFVLPLDRADYDGEPATGGDG
jgi:hypothetical protein